MSKSAEKSEQHDVEEILASKAKATALTEQEQQILQRAVKAELDAQIKENLDLFARSVVDPQLKLMKAVRAAEGKGLQLKRPSGGQVKRGESPLDLSRAKMGQHIGGGIPRLAPWHPGPWWPGPWGQTPGPAAPPVGPLLCEVFPPRT
jgi:hypothetical protein